METDIISTIKAADLAKKKALRELHRALGYSTPQDLAAAILEAAAPAPSDRKDSDAVRKPTSASQRSIVVADGKRPRISEETKKAIGDALRAGEAGSRLTEQFGVSYGIVHQIKTKLGLVTKKKATKKR